MLVRRLAVAFLAAAAPLLAGGCRPNPVRAREGAPPLLRIFGRPGQHPGQLRSPRAIDFSPDGARVYVLDRTHRLQVFTPAGEFVRLWLTPRGVIGNPRGLDVDRRGWIHVADTHNGQIVVYTAEGTEVRRWGRRGTRPGEFAAVTDVAVDGRGSLWTCQYGDYADRLQLFAPDGALQRAVSRYGSRPGELSRPQGLAIDRENNLYVADVVNHRVQVFSPSGSLLRAWGRPGSGPGDLSYPQDVALDGSGRIYVVEFGNHRVSVFTPEGLFLRSWGSPGRGPGEFNLPWGVAVSPSGDVWVADTGNDRVQVFAPLPVPG